MNEQCNSCGSYQDVAACAHCTATMCTRCIYHYSHVCEDNQKRKARGEGPTVRELRMPVRRPDVVSDVDQGLTAVRDLLAE